MNRPYRTLILIVFIMLFVIFVDLPNTPGIHIGKIDRDFKTHLGLDLQGGLQALLEADVPPTQTIDPNDMNVAQQIVENRVNGLGVSEAIVQPAGQHRIVVELPGVTEPAEALASIKQTGLLEFIDMSAFSGEEAAAMVNSKVSTDWTFSNGQPTLNTPIKPAATAEITSTQTVTSTASITPTTPIPTGPIFHTVMTGVDIKNVGVQYRQGGDYVVSFKLNAEGAQIFKDFTSTHIGQILGIALDKTLISAPSVNSAITQGEGVIEGRFTGDEANHLADLLRYGSLPIPLKVVTSETVGPTLGQDSLQKSLMAGIIGMSAVMIFMALYYRLPGLVADLALLCYALITYAIFRIGIPDTTLHLNPVTLTLPGIAGFVLSMGVAVDANILIFERIKEELHAGRVLKQSIDLGWKRAWPSIRDSNFSTLITCGILFWFGSSFGASIVKGFSLTLGIGVLVSMFTAIVVTRTFLHLVLDNLNFVQHPRWFGVRSLG